MKLCLWTKTKAKTILVKLSWLCFSYGVPKDIKISQNSFGKVFFEQKKVEFDYLTVISRTMFWAE